MTRKRSAFARHLPSGAEAVFVAVLLALCAVYATLTWGSLDAFVRAIDHTPELFADFTRYWRDAGRRVHAGELPREGYYYGPVFAVAMLPFGAIPPHWATIAWGGLQLITALGLAAVPGIAIRRRSKSLGNLYLTLLLCSVPLAHNLKWGQVSVALTLAAWAALLLYDGGKRQLAACLLGLSGAIKLYTLGFLLYYALRRDFRFVVLTLAWFLGIGIVVPILVFGPTVTWSLLDAVSSSIAAARQELRHDYNSQFLAHVAYRGLGTATAIEPARWLGLAMAAANVTVVARLARRASLMRAFEAHAVIALTIPLVVETSWPHYFVFLPLAQTMVAARLGNPWSPIRFALLAASIALASTPLQQALGSARHGSWGILLLANLSLLAALYLATTRRRLDRSAGSDRARHRSA